MHPMLDMNHILMYFWSQETIWNYWSKLMLVNHWPMPLKMSFFTPLPVLQRSSKRFWFHPRHFSNLCFGMLNRYHQKQSEINPLFFSIYFSSTSWMFDISLGSLLCSFVPLAINKIFSKHAEDFYEASHANYHNKLPLVNVLLMYLMLMKNCFIQPRFQLTMSLSRARTSIQTSCNFHFHLSDLVSRKEIT